MAQKIATVDILVTRIGVGEMLADVAQGGGAETGVTDCVQQYVGVGVAEQAFGVGNFYAA